MNGWGISEIERRLANLIRIGKVATVNHQTARATVDLGFGAITAPLPWVSDRAAGPRTWWAPQVGEQVVVLSPSGETAAGIILPAIYSTAAPAPSQNADIHRVQYEDGAVIDYDAAAHAYSITLPPGASVTVTADNVTINSDNINLGGVGGAKVARVGDNVQVGAGSSSGLWPIVEGSDRVKST